MSKIKTVKISIRHKHKKEVAVKKPWEEVKETHISELDKHGKSRQPKHFPCRRWNIQLENRKGPKI